MYHRRVVFLFGVVVVLQGWSSSGVMAQKIEMPLGSGTRLTLTPNDRTVKKFVGDTYVVSCLNGASDTEWFSPIGEKVNSTKISRVRQQLRRGGGGIDLFLQRVTLEESGFYTCRSKASNVTFNFVVIKPITFDNSLAHQTALEGSTFVIKCYAQGQSSTPKLYWKVDQRSPIGPKFKVVKDGLTVQNVTKEDSKRSYVCHAMDIDSPMPDVKSLNIALHVARKPMQVSDVDTVTEKWASLGEWANFTCKIESDPIPSFEWFGPSSSRLVFNQEVSIVNDIINGTLYSSTLQVKLTSDSKFGNYVCRGGNDMGAIEKTFMLRKSIKPTTPFLELESASPQLARIRVLRYKALPGEDPTTIQNKTTGLPVLDYIVESKLAPDSAWYPARFNTYEEGFILINLLPGTSYHVRAALKNAIGSGNFSPAIQIVTTDSSSSSTLRPPTEDEPRKFTSVKPCPPHLFQCKSGQCLSYAGQCNGIVECSDSSDEEPEMCRVALSTTYPSNIIDSTEPSVSASRSISTLAKSPLYASPARRLFYSSQTNGPLLVSPIISPAKSLSSSGSNTLNALKDNIALPSSISREFTVPTAPVPGTQTPEMSSTNETSVAVTTSANNTRTKTTINTLTSISQSQVQSGPITVTVRKKEIVITEKIETNQL